MRPQEQSMRRVQVGAHTFTAVGAEDLRALEVPYDLAKGSRTLRAGTRASNRHGSQQLRACAQVNGSCALVPASPARPRPPALAMLRTGGRGSGAQVRGARTYTQEGWRFEAVGLKSE